MKRLHVNVAVGNLEASIRFYSELFDATPTVRKPDYAKWMLDDPRVNFAISSHATARGVDHLGIQVDDEAELHAVYARLDKAGGEVVEQRGARCCYAHSDKRWTSDPSGVRWETFLTHSESAFRGADGAPPLAAAASSSCCGVPGAGGG